MIECVIFQWVEMPSLFSRIFVDTCLQNMPLKIKRNISCRGTMCFFLGWCAPNMLRTCSNISNPKVSLSTLRKCSLHCIHRWFSAKAPNAPARYVLWYSFQSHWGPEWPNVHPPEVWSPNPSPTFWVEGRQPPGMHLIHNHSRIYLGVSMYNVSGYLVVFDPWKW